MPPLSVYWLRNEYRTLLDPLQFHTIERQAEYLHNNPSLHVTIYGHASWNELNPQGLSQGRARNHYILLVYKHGIDRSRVVYHGLTARYCLFNPLDLPQYDRRTQLFLVDYS